jgi:membrane fusion protein
VGGKVVAIPVELGQNVTPGGTVAIVAPKSDILLAELYVPTRAAGFIKPGQTVKLMYQAFPYQSFGMGEAKVIAVSQTVLSPQELPIPGLPIQEPVFRVRAQLKSLTVRAYNEDRPLQPGMMLTADIILEKRSLIRWLLDPLYAAGRRA